MVFCSNDLQGKDPVPMVGPPQFVLDKFIGEEISNSSIRMNKKVYKC